MYHADTIVVGAGLAGSVATEMARLAHRPILIEKEEYAGKTNVCGGSTAHS
jgi:flavin-dependent dehydrogenase